MVLSYNSEGNLRDYLQHNHSKLTLNDRITILSYLCESLNYIHEKDLIHCDLHSGNMLVQGGGCFITDLGLCGPVDDESSGKLYGIVSYIAPELLRGTNNVKHTKKSDVYSVGMLMWEIFAGCPPFDDRAHNHHLIFDICEKGLRPPILPGIPEDYAQMMRKCWDMNPSKRPTMKELWDFSRNKLKKTINNSSSNNYINIISGSGSSSDSSQQIHKTHPLAYHMSRILDEEIAKSKSLKSNDSSLDDLDINMLTLT